MAVEIVTCFVGIVIGWMFGRSTERKILVGTEELLAKQLEQVLGQLLPYPHTATEKDVERVDRALKAARGEPLPSLEVGAAEPQLQVEGHVRSMPRLVRTRKLVEAASPRFEEVLETWLDLAQTDTSAGSAD